MIKRHRLAGCIDQRRQPQGHFWPLTTAAAAGPRRIALTPWRAAAAPAAPPIPAPATAAAGAAAPAVPLIPAPAAAAAGAPAPAAAALATRAAEARLHLVVLLPRGVQVHRISRGMPAAKVLQRLGRRRQRPWRGASRPAAACWHAKAAHPHAWEHAQSRHAWHAWSHAWVAQPAGLHHQRHEAAGPKHAAWPHQRQHCLWAACSC